MKDRTPLALYRPCSSSAMVGGGRGLARGDGVPLRSENSEIQSSQSRGRRPRGNDKGGKEGRRKERNRNKEKELSSDFPIFLQSK